MGAVQCSSSRTPSAQERQSDRRTHATCWRRLDCTRMGKHAVSFYVVCQRESGQSISSCRIALFSQSALTFFFFSFDLNCLFFFPSIFPLFIVQFLNFTSSPPFLSSSLSHPPFTSTFTMQTIKCVVVGGKYPVHSQAFASFKHSRALSGNLFHSRLRLCMEHHQLFRPFAVFEC